LLLNFQLKASILVLSKKEPALSPGILGERGTKVQGAHLRYTASMRTVKLHDPQNTFSGWEGWGLRPNQEERPGVGIPASAEFQAGFPLGKHPPCYKQIADRHTMTPGKN